MTFPLPLDNSGWSVLPTYSNNIYVSSSTGNDANAGTEDNPLQTIAAAWKKLGANTTVYFKRGDTFTTSFPGGIVHDNMTFTAYGDTSVAMPILSVNGMMFFIGNGVVANNIVVAHLHLAQAGHNPLASDYNDSAGTSYGLWINESENFLLEGCFIENFFQGFVPEGMTNVICRRNNIVDNFANSGHAQGTYQMGCQNLVYEENLFDHNGWGEKADGTVVGQLDMFSHNMYLADVYPMPVTVQNNIVARGGGCGIQGRPGGVYDNNLLISNGQHGTSLFTGGRYGSISNNVSIPTADFVSRVGSLGSVFDFQSANGEVKNNLSISNGSMGAHYTITAIRNSGLDIPAPHNMIFEGNVAYSYVQKGIQPGSASGYAADGLVIYRVPESNSLLQICNNKFVGINNCIVRNYNKTNTNFKFWSNKYQMDVTNGWSPNYGFFLGGDGKQTWAQWQAAAKETWSTMVKSTSLSAPGRTLETYVKSIGLGKTGTDLLNAMRGQRLGNWNTALTATAINGYLRQWFGMGYVVPMSIPIGPFKIVGTIVGTTGSYQNAGNTINKAFDGNPATFYDGATGDGNWLGYNFANSHMITQINFTPRSVFASRMVGGIFQASNDATWTTGVVNLYTIATAPPQQSNSITIADTNAYLYVRYLSPTGSYGNISELQVWGY